ncbi:MAG: ribosome-binding factor A [Patescibacteria group bacterium]
MKFHRSERVSSLIKEELNQIILRELEFDGAVVTIIDAEVASDLETVMVKVGVYPSNKGPDVLVQLLKRRPHLQFLLLRKINIKPMPKLMFKLEQEIENKDNLE